MPDRNDEIRKRAYEIWKGEGEPSDRHVEHWLQAERELAIDSPNTDDEYRAASQAGGLAPGKRPPKDRQSDEDTPISTIESSTLTPKGRG